MAWIYLGSILRAYRQPALPAWLSGQASITLAHELSHIADGQRKSQDAIKENPLAVYRRVVPRVIPGMGASGVAAFATAIRAGLGRSGPGIYNEMVERDRSLYENQPGEIRAREVQAIYAENVAQGGSHLVRIMQQDGSLA